MINNYNKIKNIITFDKENDYYHIKIIRRYKDNNHESLVIKTFCIESKKDFENKLPIIIELCENNKARAYINLNKRNFNRTINGMFEYLKTIEHKKYTPITFDICSNNNHVDNDPKWIIYIDNKDDKIVNEITEFIGDDVKLILPTKNGYHIICKTFDDNNYKYKYPHYIIHKDQMTILYIPDL